MGKGGRQQKKQNRRGKMNHVPKSGRQWHAENVDLKPIAQQADEEQALLMAACGRGCCL